MQENHEIGKERQERAEARRDSYELQEPPEQQDLQLFGCADYHLTHGHTHTHFLYPHSSYYTYSLFLHLTFYQDMLLSMSL